MADVQKAEKLVSIKLTPVTPAEISDSKSRLLFEHPSWKKDGPTSPVRLGPEEQLKPWEASRTIESSQK